MTIAAASDVHAELVATFERDGYVIARQLFPPHEIDEIRATFMDVVKDGPVEGLSDIRRGPLGYDPSDPLAHFPRMMYPHKHPESPVGPLSMRLLLDRRIHDILASLFGDEPVAAQTMFYFKPPGSRGQDLHQDNFYLRVAPGTCMAAWIAVDDADEGNGGMVVVPRSHKTDLVCPETADNARFFTVHHVPVPKGLRERQTRMKAGDCLFFNGSLIHGSYPNTSVDRFRRAFIAHYVPASSAEVAFYYDTIRFDGTPVKFPEATGGGPCGVPQPLRPR